MFYCTVKFYLLQNTINYTEDFEIFLNALENINMQKYQIDIELVEPIGEYSALGNEAPKFISDHIKSRIQEVF